MANASQTMPDSHVWATPSWSPSRLEVQDGYGACVYNPCLYLRMVMHFRDRGSALMATPEGGFINRLNGASKSTGIRLCPYL